MKKSGKQLINVFGQFREATVFVIIVVFCIIIGILSPVFFTWVNLKTTLLGLCCDGFLAVGMTIVLASGGMDLSVGSVMAASSVVCGMMYLRGVPMLIAVIIGLCVGVLFGIINGMIISNTNIAPMICTLGTMNMARGLAMVVTSGSPQSLSQAPKAFSFMGKGYIGPVPFLIILFLILAVVFDFLLRKSTQMRKVFYIGSNEASAKLSGINIKVVKMGVYMLCAVLAAMAGILATSRFSTATPTTGTGSEMIAISAAVIGGASTSGGEGSVFGTVLGLILLNLINNSLVLLNVSVYWQNLISGAILLLAVLLDYFSHRKQI